MMTDEQKQKAASVLLRSLTKTDRKCISSISTIHEMCRENYAVGIWSGVIDRHALEIARQTQGEVVINRMRQREELAAYVYETEQLKEREDAAKQ